EHHGASSPATPSGPRGGGVFGGGGGVPAPNRPGDPAVGGADHADVAVRFRDVLHQPVDGVVGVGRVIDRRTVERAAQLPRHDVVAFRAVLAADVLVNADVAGGYEHLVRRAELAQQVRARRALGGVGGAGGWAG